MVRKPQPPTRMPCQASSSNACSWPPSMTRLALKRSRLPALPAEGLQHMFTLCRWGICSRSMQAMAGGVQTRITCSCCAWIQTGTDLLLLAAAALLRPGSSSSAAADRRADTSRRLAPLTIRN